MTRNEVITVIENLDVAVSPVIDELDSFFDEDVRENAEFSEEEEIALENIIEASITLNDYLINFFVEVNSE